MANQKVSILIPSYNSESYIAETIESCLNQEYQNIEIIIVDDGSKDNGLKIAKGYEIQYPNIKVFTQKNSGAPIARNKAFSFATGTYIQYLDSDDLLHPSKIRLQMEALDISDDRTMVFGKWGTFQKSIDDVAWKDLPVNKDYDNPKQFLLELWACGMAAVTHAWLVPRGLIEEGEGWDEKLAKNQDGEFFARMIMSASKILFEKESVVYYRKDNVHSVSSQLSRKAIEGTLQSFETYIDLMRGNLDDPNVKNSLALVYSRYLYYVYPEYQDLVSYIDKKLYSLGYKNPILDKNKYYYLSKLIGVYGVIRLRKMIEKIKLIKKIRNIVLKYKFIKKSISDDLYRYHGEITFKLFIKSYFLLPGFHYMCWFRLTENFSNNVLKYILFRKSISYGIEIPNGTRIGNGFYIGHFGGIVISGEAKIGSNCNISQHVTIGLNPRGDKKGVPTVGDNCYIAPGAKIIGNIIIGNNVAIGANAVVTTDLPDNAVAVGIPAKIISHDGSEGYTNHRV